MLLHRRLRPGIDPALPRVAADLEWLKSKGVEVERYNLAQDIAAFTSNPTVKQALNSQGTKCLPMTLVDGKVVWQGEYPSREQLASYRRSCLRAWAGIQTAEAGSGKHRPAQHRSKVMKLLGEVDSQPALHR